MSSAFHEEIDGLGELRSRLAALREKLIDWEEHLGRAGLRFEGTSERSARNLIHYLALRSEDVRPLQRVLREYGLSSLGRTESHVLASVEAVIALLDRMGEPRGPGGAHVPGRGYAVDRAAAVEGVDAISRVGAVGGADEIGERGSGRERRGGTARPVTADEGRSILEERAKALFGDRPEGRRVRIMVTAPDEAAEDYGLVRDLVASGMNCLRINCAYGDEDVWRAMIGNLRRAERELGKACRVLMDLSGPRARTGSLEPGPTVLKVRPVRDDSGWVLRPAEVWLADSAAIRPPEGMDTVLELPKAFLDRLGPGDRLEMRDARGARRRMIVAESREGSTRVRLERTTYFANGTRLWHRPAGRGARPRSARISGVPPIRQQIVLREGDQLILTRDQRPGRPASVEDGRVASPARIPCVPPEVLSSLRVGEPIWFDEGRIGGRIMTTLEDEVVVSITDAPPTGAKLGPYKGINLPESDLRLPSLTARDRATLPFIAEHADLVGYSFIRTVADLEDLHDALDELPGPKPGVILKIETLDAFQNLPAILFEALRRPGVGIMIARGDLAVECGFERLAEVQEEILWLCEAAHLPVVWATQVLEGLAKRGLASRAEITDAAFGERAECVMLNKGPFIVETVRSLAEILQRMQEHQEKKISLLRHLRVVDDFLDSLAERSQHTSASRS